MINSDMNTLERVRKNDVLGSDDGLAEGRLGGSRSVCPSVGATVSSGVV